MDFNVVEIETTEQLRAEFMNDASRARMQNAVVKCGVGQVSENFESKKELMTSRSASSVRLDDWDITNQKRSGRCWLFSSLNLIRFNMRSNLGLSEKSKKNNGGTSFELSQNYAMFWDKFERANYFINDIMNLITQKVVVNSDYGQTQQNPQAQVDRTLAFILDTVVDDGGQWNMAVNLYTKYGVVPKEVMPETVASSSASFMNSILKTRLRKGAADLENLIYEPASSQQLENERVSILRDIWSILATNLGTPPEQFSYSCKTDDGKFKREDCITPQKFFKKYCSLPLKDYVCLVDDPSAEHMKGLLSIGISHLGNVVGGDDVLYLNTPIELMKQLTVESLTGNHKTGKGHSRGAEPVWFGCDCAPFINRVDGTWASDLFDLSGTFAVDLKTSKESRVRYGDSAMTHAMLFTRVDLDRNLKSHRFHIENSWGAEVTIKVSTIMHNNWFDDYMFEVAVHKDLLPDELRSKLREYEANGRKPDIMLPAWDPMGALA
ncbi:MAG: aminopeptidase [Candidatus Ancillula trichonymphae]|jgi:bleomycin hydrolase|nr:aminopeptidase [Candidatus Ancillula trichonymphae]